MRWAAALSLFVSLGCYEYRAQSQPHIGATVQLALTDSGAATLAPLVGTSPAKVQGRLDADSAGTYRLRVNRIIRPDGSQARRVGEQMLIRHELVAGAATRQLSGMRTLLAGGMAAAAIVAGAELIAHQRITTAGTRPAGRPTPQ